jgi:hypothetical protein
MTAMTLLDRHLALIPIRRLVTSLVALSLCSTALAQSSSQTPRSLSTGVKAPVLSPAEAAEKRQWYSNLRKLKFPKAGCFSASYPAAAWHEEQCTPVPAHKPVPPPVRHRSTANLGKEQVGNRIDVAAQVTGPPITSVEGSFPKVVDVTDVASNGTSGLYSLQLNTSQFSSPTACAHAATPSNCLAEVQFVFHVSSVHSYVYLEYWLLNFGASCPGTGNIPAIPGVPAGISWTASEGDCFFDSPSTQLPPQDIVNIGSIRLTGSVQEGLDQVTVLLPDGSVSGQSIPDEVFNLGQAWNEAEFNVFGYDDSLEAVFNYGAGLVVNLEVENGSTTTPTPITDGWTAETNNFFLANGGCAMNTQPPSIAFAEATNQSQLGSSCPPVLNPPPPPSCTLLKEGVTTAEKRMALDEAKLTTPVCAGGFRFECVQAIKVDQATIVAAEAAYNKYCSK